MDIGLPVMAGTISTVIFAGSMLPMLVKAARTRDLSSYSLSNIVLTNVGNIIHSAYVFHLPAGPVWALHTFYLATMGLMLVWYMRYQRQACTRRPEPKDAATAIAGLIDAGPGRAVYKKRDQEMRDRLANDSQACLPRSDVVLRAARVSP